MNRKEFGAHSGESLQLTSLDRPLAPSEFCARFPVAIRSANFQTEDGKVICTPQLGEHYRYGVYFYAFEGSYSGKLINLNKGAIILPTEELLKNAGIPPELLNRGVAVSPSQHYTNLLDQVTGGRRLEKISESMAVFSQIEQENITLDLGSTDHKRMPAILSIPATLSIDSTFLV